jgi:hypothetical protein
MHGAYVNVRLTPRLLVKDLINWPLRVGQWI